MRVKGLAAAQIEAVREIAREEAERAAKQVLAPYVLADQWLIRDADPWADVEKTCWTPAWLGLAPVEDSFAYGVVFAPAPGMRAFRLYECGLAKTPVKARSQIEGYCDVRGVMVHDDHGVSHAAFQRGADRQEVAVAEDMFAVADELARLLRGGLAPPRAKAACAAFAAALSWRSSNQGDGRFGPAYPSCPGRIER